MECTRDVLREGSDARGLVTGVPPFRQDRSFARCVTAATSSNAACARTLFVTLQVFQCKHCQKYFSSLAGIKGLKYPPRVIARNLCLYNLGYTQGQIARSIASEHRIIVPHRTISDWITGYRSITTFHRFRPQAVTEFRNHMLRAHTLPPAGLSIQSTSANACHHDRSCFTAYGREEQEIPHQGARDFPRSLVSRVRRIRIGINKFPKIFRVSLPCPSTHSHGETESCERPCRHGSAPRAHSEYATGSGRSAQLVAPKARLNAALQRQRSFVTHDAIF